MTQITALDRAARIIHQGYPPTHPWYYVLGGTPLDLPQIEEQTRLYNYDGYLGDHIAKANSQAEPRRSAELNRLLGLVQAAQERDRMQYLACVAELEARRAERGPVSLGGNGRPVCTDLETAVSLKYCHLTNGFVHLHILRELIGQQPSLF